MIPREKQHPHSYEILDQVIGRGDAAEIGRRLGRCSKNINQWCRAPETAEELNHTGRFNPLDHLRTIIDYVKEVDGLPVRAFPLVHYLSRLCLGFFTPWPPHLANFDDEVINHLQHNYKEFHEFVESMRLSWADRNISESEAARIETEGLEAIAAIQAVIVWARKRAEEKR